MYIMYYYVLLCTVLFECDLYDSDPYYTIYYYYRLLWQYLSVKPFSFYILIVNGGKTALQGPPLMFSLGLEVVN